MKLTENLQTATSVYINRCNNAPAGDSSIKLYACKTEGHTTLFQDRRPHHLTFLKGIATDKGKLKTEQPDLYKYFCDVQDVQKRHMKKNLPSNIFQLLSCYEEDCTHPICQKGKPDEEMTWFEGGPPLSFIPLPIPDCSSCSGKCVGHFKKLTGPTDEAPLEPPKIVMEREFKDLKRDDFR